MVASGEGAAVRYAASEVRLVSGGCHKIIAVLIAQAHGRAVGRGFECAVLNDVGAKCSRKTAEIRLDLGSDRSCFRCGRAHSPSADVGVFSRPPSALDEAAERIGGGEAGEHARKQQQQRPTHVPRDSPLFWLVWGRGTSPGPGPGPGPGLAGPGPGHPFPADSR